MRITKAILESVTSQTCDFIELDQIQVKLQEAVSAKKCLIVLDDVWNKKPSDWNYLKSPFNDITQGCKVLVTTRSSSVAQMMGTVEYHVLNQLSDDDCWSVFSQHAFKNKQLSISVQTQIWCQLARQLWRNVEA